MLIFRLGDGDKQKGSFNLNLVSQCGFEASMIVVTNLEQFVPVSTTGPYEINPLFCISFAFS